MSLIHKIKNYKNNKKILFTTPSHNQGSFIPNDAKQLLGARYYKSDFSEIEGFDNLQNPQDTILELENKLSTIYDSKKTFPLINGSTSGIIASMNAILRPNDKVLIARNCHQSVYNGLTITGAIPIWFYPKYNEEWQNFEGITLDNIKKYIENIKDIKAIIITSPTYDGIFTDISSISSYLRDNNIKIIVDEAHGALTNFGNFKVKPAIQCGADISIQSLHKTAGAPNQCALLHIAKDSQIDIEKLQCSLNLINTTSPSYPLLIAIEACVDYLNSQLGRESIANLQNCINVSKTRVNSRIKFYDGFNDTTKLLLKIQNQNCLQIANILNHQYRIEEEYSNESSLLFITGIGTNKKSICKLINVLEKVSINEYKFVQKSTYNCFCPIVKLSPRDAYYSNKLKIHKNDCLNRICGEFIINYPPGIPIIAPGELITPSNINYIENDYVMVVN